MEGEEFEKERSSSSSSCSSSFSKNNSNSCMFQMKKCREFSSPWVNGSCSRNFSIKSARRPRERTLFFIKKVNNWKSGESWMFSPLLNRGLLFDKNSLQCFNQLIQNKIITRQRDNPRKSADFLGFHEKIQQVVYLTVYK